MEFNFILFCVGLWIFATTMIVQAAPQEQPEEPLEADNDFAESNLLGTLSALQSSQPSSSSSDSTSLTSYPYEGAHENIYGTFAAPQPTLGVSINTRALLAPQVELLHLIEDFFTLSSDVIRRLNSKFHENYELIRVVGNIFVKKITGLQTFFAKSISIVRKILEFALNLFSNFSVTLPSITLGSSEAEFAPHSTYGVPPNLNSTTSFR